MPGLLKLTWKHRKEERHTETAEHLGYRISLTAASSSDEEGAALSWRVQAIPMEGDSERDTTILATCYGRADTPEDAMLHAIAAVELLVAIRDLGCSENATALSTKWIHERVMEIAGERVG